MKWYFVAGATAAAAGGVTAQAAAEDPINALVARLQMLSSGLAAPPTSAKKDSPPCKESLKEKLRGTHTPCNTVSATEASHQEQNQKIIAETIHMLQSDASLAIQAQHYREVQDEENRRSQALTMADHSTSSDVDAVTLLLEWPHTNFAKTASLIDSMTALIQQEEDHDVAQLKLCRGEDDQQPLSKGKSLAAVHKATHVSVTPQSHATVAKFYAEEAQMIKAEIASLDERVAAVHRAELNAAQITKAPVTPAKKAAPPTFVSTLSRAQQKLTLLSQSATLSQASATELQDIHTLLAGLQAGIQNDATVPVPEARDKNSKARLAWLAETQAERAASAHALDAKRAAMVALQAAAKEAQGSAPAAASQELQMLAKEMNGACNTLQHTLGHRREARDDAMSALMGIKGVLFPGSNAELFQTGVATHRRHAGHFAQQQLVGMCASGVSSAAGFGWFPPMASFMVGWYFAGQKQKML